MEDWKKRDTPTPMLLVVALLVVYAVGAELVALAERSWLIGAAGLAAAVLPLASQHSSRGRGTSFMR